MPTLKTTFFFEGVQQATRYSSSMVGWTETWYQTIVGTLDDGLNGPEVQRYIDNRLACLAAIYRMAWVRVSDVAVPGSTKTKALTGAYGQVGGFMVTTATGAAQVTCALLVDFARLGRNGGERAHHRRFLIRGLPSNIINGNVLNIVGASFNALRTFLNYVGNHETGIIAAVAGGVHWQLQFFDSATSVPVPITALVPVAGQETTITVTAAALGAMPLGSRAAISRVKFPRGVNRVWKAVEAAAAGGPFHLGTSRFAISGAYSGGGQIRLARYAYGQPDQYLIIGLRTKSTGRPFRLTRGRRRIL